LFDPMAAMTNASEVIGQLKKVRQARQYKPDTVPAGVVQELLEIAQWTGSSRNTQPWEFIVIDDKDQLQKISQIRTPINWVAGAPLAIAIVLDGANPMSEAYDEGRVTERILFGARTLGLGGGIAWFGDDSQQAQGRSILGVPENKTARGVVVVGYPTTFKDPRPGPAASGRNPLSEIVSYNTYGKRQP
jgi:nitroreductase